jgi:hypothetical protein
MAAELDRGSTERLEGFPVQVWFPVGAVVLACGPIAANRVIAGADMAIFDRINHWAGWLYPPMWLVQLPRVPLPGG